jgi:hypothetical protein
MGRVGHREQKFMGTSIICERGNLFHGFLALRKQFDGYIISKPSFFTGMSAYVIKRESVTKILRKSLPIQYQLDW